MATRESRNGLSLTSLVAWPITAGAYPGFCHETTRSIATPPGWDASPSQVIPQHFVRFAGGEGH